MITWDFLYLDQKNALMHQKITDNVPFLETHIDLRNKSKEPLIRASLPSYAWSSVH